MRFDVLVVGAGPAGCAAAIRVASCGLRVALIEKTAFPRDLPGEALHPNVDHLFSELGVTEAISKAGFIRNPGWILERLGERMFVPFEGPNGLGFGYQAWRSKMDSIFLAHARAAGTTVVQRLSAKEILVKDGCVVGLETGSGSWRCRYLIDASGGPRWLSRKLGLTVRDFSPRLVARYGYFRGECDLGIIPEFREHACGWTWLARVRKDCCQCVQLSLTPDGGRLPLPPPPFDGVRLRGADVTWRLVPECAGDGYFICGDASTVLDPAASSGVARALASGLKAAELILQAETNQMNSVRPAAAYRHWCASQFIQHARQLAGRYAALEEPPVWLRALERDLSELEEFTSNSVANSVNAVIPSC